MKHLQLIMFTRLKKAILLPKTIGAPVSLQNTNLDFLLKQIVWLSQPNTCIDTTARYAVELGYHTTLIKDGIAAFNWQEIKATIEINLRIIF